MTRKIRYYVGAPSDSCRALCKTTGGLRIKQFYSRYRPKQDHLIINWGNSTPPPFDIAYNKVLNKPQAVEIASNKLKTFRVFQQASLGAMPEFTTDRDDAEDWVREGKTIYCRTLLCSHSGQGIVVATNVSELVDAPLYTVGFKAHHEYRVHVFQGRVIDEVKKSKRRDDDGTASRLIRNYAQGWVFIRNYQSVIPYWINNVCIDAVRLLGLDFGAVDVGYNKDTDQCCIYEVNTRPGFTYDSTTCKAYANAILEVAQHG